jgi:hypothetical protein
LRRRCTGNAPEAVASPGKYGCQRGAGIGEIGEHRIGGMRAQFVNAKRTGCNCHGARTDGACACNVVWRVSHDDNVGSGKDMSIALCGTLCRDQREIRAARAVAAVCAALEVEKLNQTHHAQFETRHRRKIPGQQRLDDSPGTQLLQDFDGALQDAPAGAKRILPRAQNIQVGSGKLIEPTEQFLW